MAAITPLKIVTGEIENFQTGDYVDPAFGGYKGSTGAIILALDGGGGVITTGAYGLVAAAIEGGTITYWYVVGDNASGSIQIDLKRWNGSSYVSIIGAGNKPIISSAQRANAAVSSWTSTTIAQLDEFEFNVDSCTTFTKANLFIFYTRT